MTFKTLMMSTAIASFLAAPVMAQDTAPATDMGTGTSDMVQPMEMPMTVEEMTVDEFIGLNVVSSVGEDVGEIDYVIAGAGADAEGQAVIGIGGFLGLGEYTVALPLSAFDFDAESRNLIVSSTEDELRATPEFDESTAESVDGEMMMAELLGTADAAGASGSGDMAPGATGTTDSGVSPDTGADTNTGMTTPVAPATDGATMDGDADVTTGTGSDMGADTETDAEADVDTEAEADTEAEVGTDTETGTGTTNN